MTDSIASSTAGAAWRRSWATPLAWGGGLVLAGMGGAGIVRASTAATLASGVLLVALGVGAVAWGAVSLARGRLVAPRTATAGVVIAIIAVAANVALQPARSSVLGAVAALALLVATATLVARERRHPSAPTRSAAVLPLIAAAALVAVVATPALGAVQDAASVRDDGSLVVVDPHGGH